MDLSYHQWIIYAKFKGTCSETNNIINPGDIVMYIPGNKKFSASTYSESSKFFQMNAGSIRTGWKVQDSSVQEKYPRK